VSSRLPPTRPGRAAPPDLAAIRGAIEQAVAAGTLCTDPRPREQAIGGVRCLRFAPAGLSPRATLVHFHGGGYRLGAPELAGPFAVRLAHRCGIEVVCPTYRLAPEHPLPAGLHDGISAIRGLHEESAGALILSGDSAGGGLAASLAVLSVAEGIRLDGLVLLSAWLDLTVTSASYAINEASDVLFSRAAATEAADQYLQSWPATHPLASPLFAKLAGFPPTFVNVGSGEVLLDDARRFHAVLQDAGVRAKLSEVVDMEHTAVVRDKRLTGAAETFDAVAAFIDRLLDDRSTKQ
jgi:epsilon-lactone hydrolase